MLLFEFILKRKLLKTAMNQIKKYYSLLSINNQNYIESLYHGSKKVEEHKIFGKCSLFSKQNKI